MGPKWLRNGSQIAPKSIPKGSRMALEIIVVFEGLQDPLKIDFSANMAATCPQLGPQHAPKLGPKRCRNRSRRPMGPHGPPWSPSEPSLDRFWVDLGLISDRFWVDFWLFFCRLLGACRPLFGIFLVIYCKISTLTNGIYPGILPGVPTWQPGDLF